MTKKEILNFINEAIEEEKGSAVGMDDMFMDSDLDSLGVSLTLIMLDEEFGFLDDLEKDGELKNIEELTVRELVKKCILASSSTSKEQ
jgi:hypothetical protein